MGSTTSNNFLQNLKSLKHKSGFTLIELIIVIAMLAILFSVLVGLLNPFTQVQKSQDAQTKQNLEQLKSALDTYYNDNLCYPNTLPFGESLQSGNNVYIENIPQGINCDPSTGKNCIRYETDGSPCPKWYILFAQINSSSIPSPTSNQNQSADFSQSLACPLIAKNNCLPNNYYSGAYNVYNSCATGGTVDCSYVSSNPMPDYVSAPPITPESNCEKDFACTGGPPARCNVVSPAGTGTYCSADCDGQC